VDGDDGVVLRHLDAVTEHTAGATSQTDVIKELSPRESIESWLITSLVNRMWVNGLWVNGDLALHSTRPPPSFSPKGGITYLSLFSISASPRCTALKSSSESASPDARDEAAPPPMPMR
jgi:hypothetical protein